MHSVNRHFWGSFGVLAFTSEHLWQQVIILLKLKCNGIFCPPYDTVLYECSDIPVSYSMLPCGSIVGFGRYTPISFCGYHLFCSFGRYTLTISFQYLAWGTIKIPACGCSNTWSCYVFHTYQSSYPGRHGRRKNGPGTRTLVMTAETSYEGGTIIITEVPVLCNEHWWTPHSVYKLLWSTKSQQQQKKDCIYSKNTFPKCFYRKKVFCYQILKLEAFVLFWLLQVTILDMGFPVWHSVWLYL